MDIIGTDRKGKWEVMFSRYTGRDENSLWVFSTVKGLNTINLYT